ncbi:hypothetical protein PS662_00414 [Pseudomonas fluorescens]|uniref:Uncharacterized protein n=1 Tax=Pseudomonas fluorescens TaxID=294 RepID=A0A5E6PPE2_PSEFL|nr:hypothetical protein PS662_00414 [Pseudomonas fluorescens]
MHDLDLNTSVMDRRGFLQAFALLSLGGLMFGLSEAVVRPSVVKTDVKSEYVVINGWVLPAQHFRPTPA